MRLLPRLLAVLLLCWPCASWAAQYSGVQTVNLLANVSRSTSFSASTVNYPWVILVNYGVADAYVQLGTGPATTSDVLVPVGSCYVSATGAATGIAVIALGGPSTLRMAQADAQPGCAPPISVNNVSTATKTVNYVVATSDVSKHFNNAGAVAQVDLQLPAAIPNLNYCATVDAAQTLRLVASGSDQFVVGSTTGVASGILYSNVAGSSVCIESHKAGLWETRSLTGSWTVH